MDFQIFFITLVILLSKSYLVSAYAQLPLSEKSSHSLNETDNGPFSKDILKKFPRLDYLGPYGNRNYYIERTLANQASARANCRNLGMFLVTPRTQAELNWLTSVTSISDGLIWTDGNVYKNSASFVWRTTSTVLNPQMQLYVPSESDLGLAILRGTPNSSVLVYQILSELFYICQQDRG